MLLSCGLLDLGSGGLKELDAAANGHGLMVDVYEDKDQL